MHHPPYGRQGDAAAGARAHGTEGAMHGRRLLAGLILALLATSQPATAALAPAAPAPAALSSAATPAQLDVVRAGVIGNSTDATFFWAQERGYLREQGLDLTTTTFDSAQNMIPPLGADQLDVGGGGPGPGLFNAIRRGIPLRIVTDRARAVPGTRFNCLMVRKSLVDSGAISSFADFRGRNFAENAPGVITGFAMERHLQQVGLGLGDMNTTLLSFPDMVSAFANNAIDAAFSVEPFITLMEQRGIADCWRSTSDLEPDFQIAVILYGPAFAEQNTERGQRFMVAYLRAMRDYYRAFFGDGQGRPEMLELLTRVTPVRDLALLERTAPSWMDPNGSVNMASLRALQRWYVDRGETTGDVDLERVVDTRFVDYALGQLGRYP
jgi:NitT/TauT family transport system substrate-binding protein